MAGRGRGESAKVDKIDYVDERTAEDRARQMAAAREMGLPESEISIRGRGGFRQPELRTIPSNISRVRTDLKEHKQVDLLANFVQIDVSKDRHLQMYRVDFEPKVESASKMRELFRTASGQKFERTPIYDGVHECRSVQRLPEQVSRCEVQEPGEAGSRVSQPKTYKVTFTHTGSVAMGAEMLRVYNMHLKEFFRMLGYYQPQPGLHVHPNHSSPIGDGRNIMVLRGFKTAAGVHDENKIMMNFEGAHKLVQKKNVLEIMRSIREQAERSNMMEAIKTALVGKLVVTSYNKRAYRVEDVDFSKNPTSTFRTREGNEIRFADYFQNSHNTTIRDLQQPLLTVVPNNRRRRGDEERGAEIKLVPELCNIAGLTDPQKNDTRLKMELIKASQIPPEERVRQLSSFLQAFHQEPGIQQQLQNWGYSYRKEPLKLKAYCVPPTAIGTGNLIQRGSDSWPRAKLDTGDFVIRELARTPVIKKMAVIVPRGELNRKGQIMNNLKAGFDSIHLQVNEVVQHDMEDGDQANNYVRRIKQLDPSYTATIVIMRNQNKTIYDAVKKAACTELGLVTQVVTTKLILDERKSRSVASKVAIQIAAKIGGEPWYVDIPLKGAMVCGYDTYHDTANRGRSFGAFLASLNDRFSRWFSKADQHDRLDEMSTHVAANMLEALQAYKKFNNKLPERVIIYRDGVGEGQLEHVFKTELKSISEKVKSVDSKIRLTMIIVNKRIGARFYMQTREGYGNPFPGTVIDNTATRAERYDFYLISQSTRQGTITPTYYNIIHDEAGFGPDIHQKMALKFCFLYYNWSGSVRVPAPCQYAHKLALLCGEHLHAQPNAVLNDRLHFL